MFAFLVALTQATPAPAPDYCVHVCSADVPLADGGKLSGQLAVREDGTIDRFSAWADPVETPLDRAFSLRQFAGVGVESNARWALRWMGAGALALDPVRAVAPAFAAFRQALLAKTASVATACQREGVTISPDAEI